MADIIPKIIGTNLIQSSLKNMHFLVYKDTSTGDAFALLKEDEHTQMRRKTLSSMLEVLRNSRKILLRDPDLAFGLSHLEKSTHQVREKRTSDKKKKDKDKGKAPGDKIITSVKEGTKNL